MKRSRFILPSGKEAGYLVDAICEHPGCNVPIDRGIDYLCGSEPGDQRGTSCEGYFCLKHTYRVTIARDTHAFRQLCEYSDLCAQCTSKAAHLDWIEQAAEYRADPRFTPNDETLRFLRLKQSPHVSPFDSAEIVTACRVVLTSDQLKDIDSQTVQAVMLHLQNIPRNKRIVQGDAMTLARLVLNEIMKAER